MSDKKYLFILTVIYFALGFVNINLALLSLICILLPFLLVFITRKKTWCQGYCPRASLFQTCGKATAKHSKAIPKFFIKGDMKSIVLGYFILNLFFITMTTLRVAFGSMAPMNYLRFLLFIPIYFDFPQLLRFDILPWVTHLAFRLYSMMLTTTVIGLLLSFVFKPKTWCVICPISTISGAWLKMRKPG